jgi:hypothetical protein
MHGMGPGLRRDDGMKANKIKHVILAQARTHITLAGSKSDRTTIIYRSAYTNPRTGIVSSR